ncbi:MAG: PAS domain S-box protein, partial [Elusimicrobia bacterium]|nr:PAS domain S-box protein [Elusimicrobiota bacterium]
MADRKPEKLEPADFLLSSQNDMGLGLALLEPGTGRIKRANAVLCAIFGFGERELAALPSFAALVPADHQAGVREHLRNMDSQTATFELTAVHKSGRRIWAEVRLRQIPMKSGAFVAALVSDITRRREAEEQVLLLETITLAVNDAPDFPTALGVVLRKVCVATGWEYGIAWVPTADGKALEISPANYGAGDNIARFQTALHGVTLSQGEDLPGRAWVLRQPQWADDVALLRSFRRQTILREFGVRISMAIPVTADDQVVAVLEFCVSDRHAQAKDFFLGLASTIAPQLGSLFQRKRAEEERDRFFSISPDLLCISGFDGFFRHINGAWQKILGYSMQELMSRPIREFVHPEDRERTQEELARLKTTSDTKSYENRFVAKDGSVRWIQWSAISDVKKG